jgi:adenosylhomocysteine nucleosidase
MTHDLVTVGNKRLLYVMAAAAEYGPHLQRRIKPLMTGIGPVEASIQLSAALSTLKAADQLPDLIVSLGSAGSRSLEQCGLYQASSVSYRDMDASALGFERGKTPFLDQPIEIALPITLPFLPSARLSTGANIVSGRAYDSIDADMVDMESYALYRCCQIFHLPFIGIRGISDGKADLKQVSDWTEFLNVIDEKLGICVDQLHATINAGEINL